MAEEKKKISAKEVVSDIRAGATDEFLMKKYGISNKGLQSIFQKLIAAKLLKPTDLERKGAEELEAALVEDEAQPSNATSTQTVFRCPACNMPQSKQFEICPQCGVIVEKFLKKKTKETVIEEPGKEPTKVAEQPKDAVAESMPPPKPVESPQDKLKKVSSQAGDKVKEIGNSVAESSAFAKALELVKVPRNAAIAGVVGTIVVIFIGHLILGKADESKPTSSTVAQNVTENNPPGESGPRSSAGGLESQPKRPAPEVDPRNSTLPDSRRAVFPKMTSRDSTLPDSDEESSGYTTAPKDYSNQRQTASPPVQQFPENRPRQQLAEKKSSAPQSGRATQPSKKFATFDEAKKSLKCKDGSELLSEFPANDSKRVEPFLAASGPSTLYHFFGEVKQASRNMAICEEGLSTFAVNLSGIPLQYPILEKGDYLRVIGAATSVLSFKGGQFTAEHFCPVITPLVVVFPGGDIYQRQ